MIRINLLPPKIRQTKGAQQAYAYLVLGLSGLAVIMILVLVNLMALLHRTETRIVKAQTTYEQLQSKLTYLEVLTAREQTAQHLRSLILGFLPQQAVWISFLDELVDIIPEDLWLTQMVPQPHGRPGRLELAIEGEGYTKISVAEFLMALENSRRFDQVQLLALNDMKTDNATQVKFKVSLIYAPEAQAEGKP